MREQMTSYDRQAWDEIQRWKSRQLSARARSYVPPQVRTRLADAAAAAHARFERLPGAALFEEVIADALRGLWDLGARGSAATVRDDTVLRAFQKRGHSVDALSDLQKLDLQALDCIRPRLDVRYATSSASQGAAVGAFISGAEVFGGPPGVGTAVVALAADSAVVLVSAHRLVARTAAFYGYDAEQPDEQIFAASVVGLAMAQGSSKGVAFTELYKVMRALGRRATWDQLNKHAAVKIVQKIYAAFGERLVKRNLGKAVPALGIVIGAGINGSVMLKVADTANHVYRERHLAQKYGLAPEMPEANASEDPEADTLAIVKMVDEALRAQGTETGAGSSTPEDHRS